MFTGLIEAQGLVKKLQPSGKQARLYLAPHAITREMQLGDSLAINGCCLTITEKNQQHLRFDCLSETLEKTNLGQLSEGDTVNLERSLAAGSRLGGHFVQGHVDCTGQLVKSEKLGDDLKLEIQFPIEFSKFIASKGSIAIDGISLTVAAVTQDTFTVWIIPHTQKVTTLGQILSPTGKPKKLNLEFDILAKYVARQQEDSENKFD
ncbi:MAG: riboflavin synthase [Chthoniobacterales bacterium]